jgi:hypothetical protein
VRPTALYDARVDETPPMPEPPEQLEGHLVLRTAAGMKASISSRLPWADDADQYRAWLATWHAALGLHDVWRYRGQDRDPIDRWDDALYGPERRAEIQQAMDGLHSQMRSELERLLAGDPSLDPSVRERWVSIRENEGRALAREGLTGESEVTWLRSQIARWSAPLPMPTLTPEQVAAIPDLRASRLLFEHLGPDPNMYWQLEYVSECVIQDLSLARTILAACDRPEEREVVHAARAGGEARGAFLGYDVGEWGGHHMSALCDTVILPRYHPTPDEALETLRAFVSQLNEHLLFRERARAEAFCAWYVAQGWAEVGRFEVISVATP